MRTAHLLLDYFNVFPSGPNHVAGFTHAINRMTSEAMVIEPHLDRIDIRVYGGWKENGLLTAEASTLQSQIAATQHFPFPREDETGLIRGDVVLANAPTCAPSVSLPNMLVSRRGLPRLRLEKVALTDTCNENAELCPSRVLQRFTKKHRKLCGVQGCTVTNADMFVRREQKMVDTLLACDALALAQESTTSIVVIISDDVDFIPPLIAVAALAQPRAIFLTQNRKLASLHEPFLSSAGVETYTWEAA